MTVRQKSKKTSITVENDFENPREGQPPIHLLVRASLDDWKRLLAFNDTVRLRIFNWVLWEAEDRIKDSSLNLPRGLSKDEFNFVQKMKAIAIYTSFILREYSGKEFYRKLAEGAGEKRDPKGRKRDMKIHELTAYVLDHIFAKEKKKYAIRRKWFENADNFRRTYLNLSKIKKNTSSYFRTCYLNWLVVSREFEPYEKKAEHPLDAFALFFKEKSYLLKIE